MGAGSDSAVPLRTPPDTGFNIGLGPGPGGGSESNDTTGASGFASTPTLLTSTGLAVFSLLLDRLAEGREGEALRLSACFEDVGWPDTGWVFVSVFTLLTLLDAGG